jgi:pyridoxamine 5'-phosphate oxidase
MENPIEKFHQWWKLALANSPLQQKSAVCISTIDEDGFPNGRFVDLKSVDDKGFTFCTYLDSAKGNHIQTNPKTAMTVWWDHVGLQVRVIGEATAISDIETEEVWKTRKRSAQLTTTAFHQSQQMLDLQELRARFNAAEDKFTDQEVPRPVNWGGYCIFPISIEFLTFTQSRLHIRELYSRTGNSWIKTYLQP